MRRLLVVVLSLGFIATAPFDLAARPLTASRGFHTMRRASYRPVRRRRVRRYYRPGRRWVRAPRSRYYAPGYRYVYAPPPPPVYFGPPVVVVRRPVTVYRPQPRGRWVPSDPPDDREYEEMGDRGEPGPIGETAEDEAPAQPMAPERSNMPGPLSPPTLVPSYPAGETRAGETRAPDEATAALLPPDTLIAIEQRVIELVNEERTKAGAPPLQPHEHLALAAVRHSDEMFTLDYFSHTSPKEENREFTDRMRRAGIVAFGSASENIASTSTEGEGDIAALLVRLWMESPSHRENLLEPNYRFTGVGVWGDSVHIYATQLFATEIELAADAPTSI